MIDRPPPLPATAPNAPEVCRFLGSIDESRSASLLREVCSLQTDCKTAACAPLQEHGQRFDDEVAVAFNEGFERTLKCASDPNERRRTRKCTRKEKRKCMRKESNGTSCCQARARLVAAF